MSTEAVLQFMKQTAENEQLRQQLERSLGVGDAEALTTVVETYQRLQSGEITESEFSSALGLPETTMERTAKDMFLRDQLKTLLGVGDGDISGVGALDAQEIEALKGEKSRAVTHFALQRGYLFNVDDLTWVATAYQKLSNGEITEEAFSQEIGLADADKGQLIKKAVTFFYRGIKVA